MRDREKNVLFNDALNTFYLRLYGVRHMVKDHSDSEKGNPLPPHRLLLLINIKGSFIVYVCIHECFLLYVYMHIIIIVIIIINVIINIIIITSITIVIIIVIINNN